MSHSITLKRIYLIQLIALFAYPVFGQHLASIEWSANNELEWSNYEYIETGLFVKEALTYSSIQIASILKDDASTPNYKITALFYSSKSWINDTSSNSLLKHEQLHFDITEVFARKMRKRVSLLREAGITDDKIYLDELTRLYNECQEFQSKYDQETFSGLEETEQMNWEKRITKTLIEFYQYKAHNNL
ncbi:MAG: hypothetical protein ACI8Q1_003746 [Parvicella sp.]|jgi:hypothetical protein